MSTNLQNPNAWSFKCLVEGMIQGKFTNLAIHYVRAMFGDGRKYIESDATTP
jgi:hypothetical protein